MQEYVSDAVVLSKESRGDLDHTVSLFTRYHGKMRVKSKSTKKITSKLSAHLEPGNVARIRIVEVGGLQVVDALKMGKVAGDHIDLHYLDRILEEGQPDHDIWMALFKPKFDWRHMLRILGWDPEETTCVRCVSKKPTSFYMRNQEFFCDTCSLKLSRNELVYL